MSWSLGILGVLILAGIFVFMRRNRAPSNARPAVKGPPDPAATTEFHAVSIKFASSACEAAKSMEGKRFLSSAAPRLPLPECDVLECKCRFVHYKDRRDGEDRRNPYGGLVAEAASRGQEKRKGADRRKTPDPFNDI